MTDLRAGAGADAGLPQSASSLASVPKSPSPSPIWVAFATAGGLGYAPVAPGTFGAAGGVGLFAALALVLPATPVAGLVVASLTGAILLVGARASTRAECHFGRHDDGRIVVDEVAGQLAALLPIAALAPQRMLEPAPLLLGFLTFRLLDIWKPGPVRLAEQRFEAGWGVMLDDVVAGLLAGLVVTSSLLAGWLP